MSSVLTLPLSRMRRSLSLVSPRARGAAICWLGAALLGGCRAGPGEPQRDVFAPPAMVEDEDPNVPVSPSEPSTFLVPTYDSSGELVHPDAFVSPKAWRGSRYWFAATPYPSGDASFENPSIFTSRRTRDWQPPAG